MKLCLLSEQPFVVTHKQVGWRHRSGTRSPVPPNFAQSSGFLIQLLNGIQTKDINGETQYACLLPIRQRLWGSWGVRTSSPPQSPVATEPLPPKPPSLPYSTFQQLLSWTLCPWLSLTTHLYSLGLPQHNGDPHVGLSKSH